MTESTPQTTFKMPDSLEPSASSPQPLDHQHNTELAPPATATAQPSDDGMLDIAPPEPSEEPITGAKPFGPRKRTPVQRESDIYEVGVMMVQKFGGYLAITKEMNRRFAERGIGYTLSSTQIRADIAEVKKRWAQHYVDGTARQRIAMELALIDHIEREAWNVYQRSLRDDSRGSQTTRNPITASGVVPTTGEIMKLVSKHQRDGDVAPLILILKCSERRSSLLGLDTVKVELNDSRDKDAKFAQMAEAYRKKIERDIRREMGEEPWMKRAVVPDAAKINVSKTGNPA